MPLDQTETKSLFEVCLEDQGEDSPKVSRYKEDVDSEDPLRINFGDLVLRSKHSMMSSGNKSTEATKDIFFNGFKNADKINQEKNGFSIEDKEFIQMQHASRMIDIIFFCHGQLTPVEKKKIYPDSK